MGGLAAVVSSMRPNLDDARALLARARKHFAEFNALVHPRNEPGLWRTTEAYDPRTTAWFYCLHMDRQRLIAAKPIISDSATNLMSALDHVVAAIAKANGRGRLRLYFPWGFTDEAFGKALAEVERKLSLELNVLADARKKHRHEVHHVEAAKQISNSGKHWELMFATGSAHGVSLYVPGSGQRIFQVPANSFAEADVFEFYGGPNRLPRVPLNILVGLTIGGLDECLPKSPHFILKCSFRFVEGMVAAVSNSSSPTKRAY